MKNHGTTEQNPRRSAVPAAWPDAHFIVRNPPFLGGNLVRQGLGDDYVESLFKAYDLPNFSDLCCYGFELARKKLEAAKSPAPNLAAALGAARPRSKRNKPVDTPTTTPPSEISNLKSQPATAATPAL